MAACGTAPEEPEPANRVAAAAWREWRIFGEGSIVHAGNDRAGRPMKRGIVESREPARSRIGEYWRAVGRPEWNGADKDRAWSAAFISWVMARAGISASEFPPSGRHADYLLAIEARRGSRTALALRDPDPYRAQPGDLLCRGNGGNVMRLGDAGARRAAIDRHVAHCEVAISLRRPYLRTIGGNVQDSVMLVAYPLDASDRPIAAGGAPWMLIVQTSRQ